MKRRPQRRRNWPRAGVVLANKRRSLHSGTSAAPVACGSGTSGHGETLMPVCVWICRCVGVMSLCSCFVLLMSFWGETIFVFFFFFVCVLAVIT